MIRFPLFKNYRRAGSWLNRYLPAVVFLVVTVIGVAMTFVVRQATLEAKESQFELIAEDAVDRLVARINEHIALLSTTRALFQVNDSVLSRAQFADFVDELLADGRYGGIQGMGFARLMHIGEERLAENELALHYLRPISVRPSTQEKFRTPIVLLEPNDERNEQALGYDMFSQKDRKAAMMLAIETGKPSASSPVELVQEITEEKQAGFLVYLAVKSTDINRQNNTDLTERITGFVYAPFRSGDLHNSVLQEGDKLPVVVHTSDITEGPAQFLFKSRNFDQRLPESRFQSERTAEIAGRIWHFDIVDSPDFNADVSPIGSFLIGSLALLFAAALAASTRSQIKRMETVQALAEQKEENANRSELMLLEMKHRIKNHIARIQAISRQTARSSSNLEEYTDSFSTRLQALANAQDVLTRSHWQCADLQELVQKELEQVFGAKHRNADYAGPVVELDERQAQAMSLILHELATNALKYGGVTADNGNLLVIWELEESAKGSMLKFSWIEHSNEAYTGDVKAGFGTRLIDASVKGELGGTIQRQHGNKGLSVILEFPINSSVVS